MARRKKHQQDSAGQRLDEIETRGDQLVEWVTQNPMIVLGTAAAILLLAGAYGFSVRHAHNRTEASAAALAIAQDEYRSAMGASPGSLVVAEPANAETGRRVRQESVARFQAVAEEHSGTTAAAVALIEAGRLQDELGETDAARASYEKALAAKGGAALAPFALTRLGALHERAGQWTEAAESYEKAAAVADYPLRYDALADAIRCYAVADERDRAMAAYAKLSEAGDYQLPPHIQARVDELLRKDAAEAQ